jgi:transposase-like protein
VPAFCSDAQQFGFLGGRQNDPFGEISHVTVRYWWNRFGPIFAAEVRHKRVERMRAQTQWRWHLDEVFVKVNGVRH